MEILSTIYVDNEIPVISMKPVWRTWTVFCSGIFKLKAVVDVFMAEAQERSSTRMSRLWSLDIFKKTILLTLILLITKPAISQVNLDSLRIVWNDVSRPDTARLAAVQKMIRFSYRFSNPDSAFYYIRLQYDFAESRGLERVMALSLKNQGSAYMRKSHYKSALNAYLRSLGLFTKLGDESGIGPILNDIGRIYYSLENYDQAIDYFSRCIDIKESLGKADDIVPNLNNTGSCYKNQGIAALVAGDTVLASHKFAEAIRYYFRSLAIHEKHKNQRGMSNVLSLIGRVYQEQGDYIRAINYLIRGLQSAESSGILLVQTDRLFEIGNVYKEKGKYSEALDYHSRSFKIRLELGRRPRIAASMNAIAGVYLLRGMYDKAILYSQRCMALLSDYGFYWKEKKEATRILYMAHRALGKSSIALEMYELHDAMDDSLDQDTRSGDIFRQLYELEFDRRVEADSVTFAQRIRTEKVTQSRRQLIFFFGMVILVAVFYIVIRRRAEVALMEEVSERRAAQEKLSAALKEKKILIQEIHHRVKNNMQVLNSLTRLQYSQIEHPEVRELLGANRNRIRAMSLVHDTFYQAENYTQIDLRDFIEKLLAALLRFYNLERNKIQFRTEIENITLGIDDAVPCGLIINELVSNIIQHAFPEGHTGEAAVDIGITETTEDKICLHIVDNGVGIQGEINLEAPETLGFLLINVLAEQLCGSLELNPIKGTDFRLTFKRREHDE